MIPASITKMKQRFYVFVTGTLLGMGSVMLAAPLSAAEHVAAPSPSDQNFWRSLSDGPSLFAARCAVCHTNGYVVPSAIQLSRLTADEIEDVLWNEVMKEYANGLDSGQRRMIADFVSSLSKDKPADEPGVPLCKEPRKWVRGSQPSESWPGTSADNTFSAMLPELSKLRTLPG